ncbi:DUF551 domain-containing protein [Klebsiella pneumoniae]
MTKSTITRERLEALANAEYCKSNPGAWLLGLKELNELAQMALAAMESEPVAYISKLDFDAGYPHILARRDFNKACTMAVYAAQPAPVVPDGYVMVPIRLTAENGAKRALSGEFSETKFVNCPECFGDDECETCDGSGRIEITVPVTWTTIKEIWAKGVEHFAAAPQSPGSEPATVPGKWIPVSERMPERGDYLVTDGCDFDVQLFNGEQFIPGFVWEDKITHWMPLPAAPQGVIHG